MENTLSFSLTEQTISIARFCHNAHGRAVFSLCCQFSFFTDWNGQESIRANWKDFFFKTSRYILLNILRFLFCKSWGFVYILFSHIFFTLLPLTIICDQPSSQRSDQSSSWFEADRRGHAGFEFSSWLAWIFSDNVWQVHKFKSAMTILFTDIVSTTHRVKQETTCNFTARTRILRFFWNWIECAERLNWEL